jgi:hypothetical protein
MRILKLSIRVDTKAEPSFLRVIPNPVWCLLIQALQEAVESNSVTKNLSHALVITLYDLEDGDELTFQTPWEAVQYIITKDRFPVDAEVSFKLLEGLAAQETIEVRS